MDTLHVSILTNWLWSKEPAKEGPTLAHLMWKMKKEGAASIGPIRVVRKDNMGQGKYLVIDGVHRLEAARRLGLTSILCEVEQPMLAEGIQMLELSKLWSGPRLRKHDEGTVRKLARAIEDRGFLVEHPITVVERSGGLDQDYEVINGWLRILAARSIKMTYVPCKVIVADEVIRHTLEANVQNSVHLDVDKAYQHGKMMGRIEGRQEEFERQVRTSWEAPKPKPKAKAIDRGLVRCLEPRCKTWIKHPASRPKPTQAAWWFCKQHQTVLLKSPTVGSSELPSGAITQARSISTMPLFDRDGDPIWITRECEVFKVQLMDDDHLTNCLHFLESAAKNRCKVTGVPEAMWMERVSTRYRFLVDEATHRDERLKCPCKEGIVAKTSLETSSGTTITEVFCKDCILGKHRRAAKEVADRIAEAHRGKKAMKLKVALVMVVSLIVGSVVPLYGSQVVQWVIEHLRASGTVK